MSSPDVQIKPIVVDNASSDPTVECVRESSGAHLIENHTNVGFAAAANQGARAADSADFILLLNPDASILNGVEPMVDACRQYGLAAGKLVDEGGRAQTGFTLRRLPTPTALLLELLGINRLWPSNPINRGYRYLDRNLDLGGAVEQPAGAFLMVRPDVWKRLNGLDEQFNPVWFEDVDFCHRALDAGYRIEYVPAVAACHIGGHSVNRVEAGQRAAYWCVSLLRYSRKYFRGLDFRGICLGMIIGSIPRMTAGMVAARSFSPLFIYLKIMRHASACLIRPANVGKALTVHS